MATVTTNTKKVSDLTNNSSPANTDYVLTATSNIVKRTTVSDFKTKMGTGSGYKILDVSTITLSTSSTIASGATTTVTNSFTVNSNATKLIPLIQNTGWCVISNVSATKDGTIGTLSTKFLNTTSCAHSGNAVITILQLGSY